VSEYDEETRRFIEQDNDDDEVDGIDDGADAKLLVDEKLSATKDKLDFDSFNISEALINRTHYPRVTKPYSRLDQLLEHRLKQHEQEQKHNIILQYCIKTYKSNVALRAPLAAPASAPQLTCAVEDNKSSVDVKTIASNDISSTEEGKSLPLVQFPEKTNIAKVFDKRVHCTGYA